MSSSPPKVRTGVDGRELRLVSEALQSRAAGADGGALPFAGHAVVYDRFTTICDMFGDFQERIVAGACRETILADDIRLLVNHDPNLVLARSRGEAGGTLRLSEDPIGVLVEAEIAPTTYGRDLAVSLARGDVSGMSFSFRVVEELWDVRADGVWLRDITKLQMFDVSAVTYPAYEETDAAMRSRLMQRAGKRGGGADVLVMQRAIGVMREQADSLESILSDESETDSERAASAAHEEERQALAADRARRHRAMGVYLGMPGTTQEEK